MELEINVCPNCLKRAELNNMFLLPKCRKFAEICGKCAENLDVDNISEETENTIIKNSKVISEKIYKAVNELFSE